ncbi:MAG: hypothetical protein HY000_03655 [Planctomycetes bacterium]|nr:hypothetical protein [Planctomycetota bacterium]
MAILSGIALGLLLLNRFFASPRVDMVAGFWWLSWLIAFALPPLMGACVFLAEQEGQRFRFFAARGIPARQVWLGKHLVWLPMTELAGTIACGVTIATWAFLQSMPMGQVWANWPLAFFGLLWPFVGYSAGQFVSMLIPRGLLAGVVALVLAACVASWKALMGWLGVNLFLSVAPIPVVLMLITWLRAPEWMLERHKLGSWLRIAGVLTASAAALIGVVAAYRMYEIPAREPGFSPD